MFGTGADTVIPGRCEASNPESRDSGSGPADHPGMTVSGLHVIASEAKQSISPRKERMDCFASLAMTALQLKRLGCLKIESVAMH
jgi:hypothetical protein